MPLFIVTILPRRVVIPDCIPYDFPKVTYLRQSTMHSLLMLIILHEWKQATESNPNTSFPLPEMGWYLAHHALMPNAERQSNVPSEKPNRI